MKRIRNDKYAPLVLTLSMMMLLCVSVFFLMNYVQSLLNSDVSIAQTEIVTQNRDVITSKIEMEINNLSLGAKQISEMLIQQSPTDTEARKKLLMDFLSTKQDSNIFVADDQGKAYFADGQEVDISGRSYYRVSMTGKNNITDRLVSRLPGGEDVFIFSVPIEVVGEVVGTLQAMYTPQDMYNICKLSLFSSQGTMYIINSSGYVLITSQSDGYSLESDNYYRMIYANDLNAAKKLESDIKENKSGTLETTIKEQRIFFSYTPINDIEDWYLISSIASDTVFRNMKVVVKIFYYILIGMVIVFTVMLGYLWRNRQKNQEKIEKIAFFDGVTEGKTYNRFDLDLREALAREEERTCFVMMVDINNFKFINNFYGFEMGDKILRALNDKLQEQLAPGESAARVYNDHFSLLLLDGSPERVERILDGARELEGIKVYLNAGIYQISNPKESIRLMIDKANLAAQSVKNVRNQQIGYYSDQFDAQMMHNEQLKRSIEEAIKNNEFEPFFQPKTNINDRQLYGAEALARWRKPDGKLVSPGEFIPTCENTGLILDVDMIIFEKTLQFIRKNLDQGVACVPISVNFSKLHLDTKDFVERIIGKIKEYQVPPQLLELELTETAMFENYKLISRLIEELHSHELSISMDDFGTGYSSLSMLKNIDIDVLKIDGAFLRDVTQEDKQKIIFASISQMAKELGIDVVVEGVETEENVGLMRDCGCMIAQGYFFSRPLPLQDFEKIYQAGIL